MIIPEDEVADRFWSKVKKFPEHVTDCWLWWAAKSSEGYGRFRVNGKLESPHRMVYEWYHGEIPKGYDICHHCDNPSCVNPDHLFAGTRSDNMLDASKKGLLNPAKGEGHPFSKLRKADVKRIKQLLKRGRSYRSIADLFDVSADTISDIALGKNWKHV